MISTKGLTKDLTNKCTLLMAQNIFLQAYIFLDENCLINNSVSVFRKIINLPISYTLDPCSGDLNTVFTSGNCLYGVV